MAMTLRDLLPLLVVLLAGVWVVHERRRRSYVRLLRRCYRRMDVALGIKAHILEHRANQRRKYGWFLPPKVTNFFWPPTQYGGIAALPFLRRREMYVHLHMRQVPWPRRWFTWHCQGGTVEWTMEVDASFAGFIERVERGFADFLFLKYRPGLFDVHDHRDDHPPAPRVTVTRAKPAQVPDQLVAHEELAD
jgi:hypothetical protein